jgi:hypothetical protein
MAFNIAKKATPTSANTASHMVANPPAPNKSTIALTTKAKPIFWYTTFFVAFAILIAATILLGSSF